MHERASGNQVGARVEHRSEDRYRIDSERVEQLLEEIRGMAGPATWQRVEELLQRIVGLYGAGLSRVLNHVADAGGISDRLVARLMEDELVTSLLLIHGLHPVPVAERVRRALEQIRPYLGSHAGDVELADLTPENVVRLRLLGSCQGCPSSRATVEHTLRRAIEEAAPEVTAIEVEGIAAGRSSRSDPLNVPLRGTAMQAPQRWKLLHTAEIPSEGERRVVDVEGSAVLIAGVGGALVAYRNACPSCGAPLDRGNLERGQLACAGCGKRYDLGRAGRPSEGEGAALVPIPLLPSGKTHRIAVPGGAA